MEQKKMGFPNGYDTRHSKAAQKEPAPTEGDIIVLDEVIKDLYSRSEIGTKKYGTPLKTFNGRNALMDAYQESSDLLMYLKQALIEQGECITLNDYQALAQKTAIYPGKGSDLNYPIHGLNGEAGEVADKFKKIIRDKGSKLSKEDRYAMAKELGDVLWYVSEIAFELNFTLEEIATMNIEKLSSRMDRGMIGGSGDDR